MRPPVGAGARTSATAVVTAVVAVVAALLASLLASPSYAVAHVAHVAPTVVRGWDAAPSSVTAATAYVARVRVSGGVREVRLRRLDGGAWATVAAARSGSTGRATLTWTAPAAAGPVVLRVQVVRSATRAAASTPARRGLVVAAPDPAPDPTPEPSPDPTPEPTPDPTPTGDPALTEVLALVNRARATGHTCGGVERPAVGPLVAEPRLARAAGAFATRMATEDFFSHTSPDGASPGDRIDAEGYRWRTWGENIAAGYATPDAVVAGWLASSGHCANIMNGAFTEIGIGRAVDGTSRYGTYWVQDFAAPR